MCLAAPAGFCVSLGFWEKGYICGGKESTSSEKDPTFGSEDAKKDPTLAEKDPSSVVKNGEKDPTSAEKDPTS